MGQTESTNEGLKTDSSCKNYWNEIFSEKTIKQIYDEIQNQKVNFKLNSAINDTMFSQLIENIILSQQYKKYTMLY